MRVIRWSGLALLLLACGEGEPAAAPPASPPPPSTPPPIAPSRPLSEAAAFALVPAGEGALLTWAASTGVRALPLDPLGSPAGPELTLAPGSDAVVELDAASAGRRLALAWVIDRGELLEVKASYSLDGGRSFAAAEQLGPTVRAHGARGRLDMSAQDGGALVLYHRIPEGPCMSSAGTCARIARTAIGEGTALERTDPLEVQHPCDPLVSGALWHDGTSYHAVCHADPEPSTLVYAIRPALQYAVPVDMPAGCTPLGIAPLDVGVAVVTRCGDRLVATHLDAMGRELARFSPVERSVACEEGRPALTIGSGGGGPRLHLEGAREELEALLPESIAPSGARAIWTGEALLVAGVQRGELSLRRYQCAGETFARTDVR